MTVFLCLPMRVGIKLIASLFDRWWESSRDFHTCMIQWVLFVFLTRQFWIIIFWSYEPCRYFTAKKVVERWSLLTLTTGHVVVCQMFVSVCQAWSCTNIMCRAACITSVLHECFSEYYNLSVEICSCLTLSLLDHDCLYQAGLLTICYAVVWQEQSSWILCILVLLLIWVLQIVIACAASWRTIIDYPLVLSLRRDLCW